MLNKYNLIISPLAKKDLNSIYDYVWLDLYSKISASKLINDFYKAFESACHKDLENFFEGYLNGTTIISKIS